MSAYMTYKITTKVMVNKIKTYNYNDIVFFFRQIIQFLKKENLLQIDVSVIF